MKAYLYKIDLDHFLYLVLIESFNNKVINLLLIKNVLKFNMFKVRLTNMTMVPRGCIEMDY